jgi:hypothetical protein
MTELIGQRLANKYDIQSEIGRGGMGVVYRAFDVMLERPVAVKILPVELTFDQQFVARFRKEAVTAASLHHANIVTIHDVGQQDHIHYIVMQFLAGWTLDQWLMQRGPMAPAHVSHLVRQISDALDYAHRRGIIHRDIKPSNIMVDAEGHATLMDFGLVRAGEGTGLTRSGVVVGTPDYMAPEQALGKEIDYRSDIYSLGVVVYRALCGQAPFVRSSSIATAYAHVHEAPPPLRQLRPDLPKAVEAAVLKALAKDPADRFQEAGQFAQELARASAGKGSTSAPTWAVLKGSAPASPPRGAAAVKPAESGPRQAPADAAPPAQTTAPTQIMGAAPAAPTAASENQSKDPAPVARPADDRVTVARPAADPAPVARPTADRVTVAMPAADRVTVARPAADHAPVARPAARRPRLLPYLLGAAAALLLLLVGYFTLLSPEHATPTPTAIGLTATSTSVVDAGTITATVTLAPTRGPLPRTDTATPPATDMTPTATDTLTFTPVLTATPVKTATPTATAVQTPTFTATPTHTRTPQKTATPTRTPGRNGSIRAPVLISPLPGTTVKIGSNVEFVWRFDGQLAANQGFEIRVWKEGQPAHYGAASPVRTTSAVLDLSGAYGVQLGGGGRHLWTVAVVQIEPYQALGPEAPPQTIEIEGAPPTPRP